MERKVKRISIMFICFSLTLCYVFSLGITEATPSVEANKLIIYTPHEKSPALTSIKEFQERTGIQVEVVFAGTGELLDRIRLEKESNTRSVDVLWGGGAESIAANLDLFEPYVSTVDALIPPEHKDSSDLWIGESPVPVVIMYNTTLVTQEEAPKSWSDLLDPKWREKIAFADPAKSGSAYTILATMLISLGGYDSLKLFADNLKGHTLDSSKSVYEKVADGQYSIGLTQEKSVQTLIKQGAKVAISYPEDGTTAVDDTVAIVKGTQKRDEAIRFVEYVLSIPHQKMMESLYNKRPVRLDLAPPEGLPKLKTIPLIAYDLKEASATKAMILNKWETLMKNY